MEVAEEVGVDITDPDMVGIICADVRHIFKVVFQSILLFGSKIWVVTPRIGRMLVRFHTRVSLHITGKQPQRWTDGRWE